MADFKNRNDELTKICNLNSKTILYNVFGEAGIGKTRLLLKSKREIELSTKDANIFYIDLLNISSNIDNRIELTLKSILKQDENIFSGTWQSVEQVAGLIEQPRQVA